MRNGRKILGWGFVISKSILNLGSNSDKNVPAKRKADLEAICGLQIGSTIEFHCYLSCVDVYKFLVKWE